MKNTITIANRKLGLGNTPFILAEMSGNHNQSLERALAIVDAAAQCGCDGIKLQTYTPDTMTLDLHCKEFIIKDHDSLWYGKSLYDLYAEAMTPWEWHKPIFDRCKELNMVAFSTPFDESALDFLETLDVPAYKIASFENIDIPLLRKVAATGKPVIMSTGMATIAELDESVRCLRDNGCKDLILLKCTSMYPASPKSTNLLTIPNMRDLFKTQIGLSDHTLGIGVSIASVALGVTLIEKHFTLNKDDEGVDAAFSMDTDEMSKLVHEIKQAWEALGSIVYQNSIENFSRAYRRSLYISKNLKKGDILSEYNIRSIRPGRGLPPKYYEFILGKRINQEAQKGTPLSWDLIG